MCPVTSGRVPLFGVLLSVYFGALCPIILLLENILRFFLKKLLNYLVMYGICHTFAMSKDDNRAETDSSATINS